MIKKLLAINGMAILGAVLYHAAGWGFISMFWWTDRYRLVQVPNFDQLGSFSYYGLRFVEQIIIFAIPVFLFVSGYFITFATGKESAPKWSWIFTRIKFLVIPYLLWSLLMVLMNILFGQNYQILELLTIFLTGKAVAAFYFIPLLVQLYLLAPFLTRASRKKPLLLLFLSFLLMLFIRMGQYASILGLVYPGSEIVNLLLPSWFFPGNLFWLVLGISIGFYYKNIAGFLTKRRWVFLALTIVLIPIGMWEWESLLAASGQDWIASRETFIDNIYSIMLILSFIGFNMNTISRQKWLNVLGSKSFGIYLTHTLFITVTAKVIYQIAPFIFQYQIVFQPILVAAAILGPLILMEIVKRTALNRFYVYIFG